MLSLFTRNKSTDRQTPVDDGQSVQADETLTAAVKGRQPLKRPGKMTRQDEEKVYHANPSIIDFLPWQNFSMKSSVSCLMTACRWGPFMM
ncbi:hypothetical protein L243_27405 [Salmonella enterica subsp. enterica serovar Worthington str. BCH-3008]|nr:hypothetical protein L243_27405 [Salmonella enterica subsp. enterica serovar Worthington str. BCH-3008]